MWGRPSDFAIANHGRTADNFILEIQLELFATTKQAKQLDQIVAVKGTGLGGEPAGQIGVAEDRHAMLDHLLVGAGQFTISAALGCEIHDNRALLHAADHLPGDEDGGFFAGDHRRGHNDVHLGRLLGEQLHLRLDELLAHHLGVAALAGTVLLELQLEEFRAHAPDLVFDRGPGVEGAHDGTQLDRRPDGRQPGNAGADDQHLGRRHAAGGGDLAGEKASELAGGLDHRAVPGDVGHRTERVHRLRPGDARDGVHRDGVDPALGQALEQVAVLCRLDEADQRRPLSGELDFITLRRANLEQDVGLGPDLRGGQHNRTSLLVECIGKLGRLARTGLNRHLEAKLDELGHVLRCGGDTTLTGRNFFWYSY